MKKMASRWASLILVTLLLLTQSGCMLLPLLLLANNHSGESSVSPEIVEDSPQEIPERGSSLQQPSTLRPTGTTRLYIPQPAQRDYIRLSDMQYERPIIETARSLTDDFVGVFLAADDFDGQLGVYLEYCLEISRMNDMYVYALVEFYRNVNADTQAELDFCEDFQADYSELQNGIYKMILESKYVEEWEAYLGEALTEQMRTAVEMFDERMVDIYRQIFRLRNEYTREQTEFMTKTVSYNGTPMTSDDMVSQILYDVVANPERAQEIDQLLIEHTETLNRRCDTIYDQLLSLRTQVANVAGYDNYVDYALSVGSYDVRLIKQFVKDVRETMIPLMVKIRAKSEELLGEPLNATNYSLALFAPTFASKFVFEDPRDSVEQAEQRKYDAAMQLLRGLMPELNELAGYLEEYEMIDVFSRENKSSGGFSVTFPYLQQPFIYSQTMNVSTIIHESGHALNAYYYPKIDIQERFAGGSEINEIHSMGLEMLALDSYELLYGDTAAIAILAQIYDALSAILSQTMYYEFELTLYEQPDMTREERNVLFSRLVKEYGHDIPGISIYDTYGGNWVKISHMFEQPLYTIDYSLSQLVSFEIYEVSLESHEKAKEVYMSYLLDNQTLDLRARLANAGLHDPFDRENMEAIAAMVESALMSDEYWRPLKRLMGQRR